jgi:hypothetical protein
MMSVSKYKKNAPQTEVCGALFKWRRGGLNRPGA